MTEHDTPGARSLRALRQSIIDAPHDESLRDVYLDCALELGDPHGEYVRLGVELERRLVALEEALGERPLLEKEMHFRPRYPALAPLHDAIEDLYARHGHEFFAHFLRSPHFGRRTHFDASIRAGFVDEVSISTQEALDFAASVAPITAVEVSANGVRLPESVRRISGTWTAAGHAQNVVVEADLDPHERTSAAWVRSPAFRKLRRLHAFGEEEPAPQEFVTAVSKRQELVEVSWSSARPPLKMLGSLPRLRTLSLDVMPTTDHGFASLRALTVHASCDVEELAPWIDQGCRLLRVRDVTDRRVTALNPKSTTISRLPSPSPLHVLYAQTVDEPVLRAFALGSRGGELGVVRVGVKRGAYRALCGLELREPGYLGFASPLSDEDLVALGRCRLRGVKTLRLPGVFSREALELFSRSSVIDGLAALTIGCRDARDLAPVLTRAHALRSLSVDVRGSNPNGHLQMIMDRAHLHHLRYVSIAGDRATDGFFRSPAAEHLRELWFRKLSPDNERAIIETPRLTRLNRLTYLDTPSSALERRFGHRLQSLAWSGGYEHLPAWSHGGVASR